MKKVLSLILTLCMVGAFAISASAAPTDTTSHKLNIVETETGATVEYIMSGEFENFSAIKCIVTFDSTKVTYADIAYEEIDGWKGNMTSKGDNYLIFTNGEAKGDSSKYITGNDQKVATITFNKVDNASLTKDDIKIAATQKVGRTTHKITTAISGAAYDTGIAIAEPSFTAYVPDPKDPVITVDDSNPVTGEGNGIVTCDYDDKGNYDIDVVAPIGKKAVIYFNDVAQAGTTLKGTVDADTVIKIEYVDDDDFAVITYPVVYTGDDGIAVFAKATIGADDKYGIKFTGTKDGYKDVTDGMFYANANVGGIFGVQIADAEDGDYTAQAFVNDSFGRTISFTK